MDLIRLSKKISHALRHEPWVYELELDAEGWTDLEALLESIREGSSQWSALNAQHVEEIIRTSNKVRFEIKDGRIRATYGHSVPGKVVRTATHPPDWLYHGTAPTTAALIRQSGLLPMRRQYVHLSTDRETAQMVGQRKSHEPVILVVRSAEAFAGGVSFYDGNDKTWLADQVPPGFIDFPD